jgi:hypothetical protein
MLNEEKTNVSIFILLVLHKSHLKYFSSNINTPVNLRNNLVNFVFVVVVIFEENIFRLVRVSGHQLL